MNEIESIGTYEASNGTYQIKPTELLASFYVERAASSLEDDQSKSLRRKDCHKLIHELSGGSILESMLITQMLSVHDLQQRCSYILSDHIPLVTLTAVTSSVTKLSNLFVSQLRLLNEIKESAKPELNKRDVKPTKVSSFESRNSLHLRHKNGN